MIYDIKRCSIQSIHNTLGPLEYYKNYVCWIRTRDMLQQIYMTNTFKTIWQQGIAPVYEVPLIWFDYLNPDHKLEYMKQLGERHNQAYRDPMKNQVFYQIVGADGLIKYIRCQCYKCVSFDGEQYVIGIAKNMDSEIWHPQYQDCQIHTDDQDEEVKNLLFFLLKQSYGITILPPMRSKYMDYAGLRDYLIETQEIVFSARETECLYHLCAGKTAKIAAKDMGISPRTVETYLESIRAKSGCHNKFEVISRFARICDRPLAE